MWDIYAAILLFGATSIMGIYLSILVLSGKQSSKPVILFHGLFTISGFVILSFHYPQSSTTIDFFAVATLSGLVLLYQDINGIRHSRLLCFVHGVLTTLGFISLIWFAIT